MHHRKTRGRRRSGSIAGAAKAASEEATQLEPIGVAPKVGFRLIGCGVTKGYQLIANGELQIYKIGRATRITLESARAYVGRRLAETPVRKAD